MPASACPVSPRPHQEKCMIRLHRLFVAALLLVSAGLVHARTGHDDRSATTIPAQAAVPTLSPFKGHEVACIRTGEI